MKKGKVHIITAYFPIRTKEKGRKEADYFRHIHRLVESFKNVQVCLYAPQSCNTYIDKFRGRIKHVSLELEELPTYWLLKEIFADVSPDPDKPIELRDWRYLTVQYAKFYLAHRYLTLDSLDSQSSRVLWLDAGIMRFLTSPDTSKFISYVESKDFDLLCQLNIFPYYLNVFRSFEKRILLGKSVTCGSVIGFSLKGAGICHGQSMKYLNEVRDSQARLHNEQIFLSYIVTSVRLRKLIYLRRFSSNHIACVSESKKRDGYAEGVWIKGFTYFGHTVRLFEYLIEKTILYLPRRVLKKLSACGRMNQRL